MHQEHARAFAGSWLLSTGPAVSLAPRTLLLSERACLLAADDQLTNPSGRARAGEPAVRASEGRCERRRSDSTHTYLQQFRDATERRTHARSVEKAGVQERQARTGLLLKRRSVLEVREDFRFDPRLALPSPEP
jgi:hypothetical protein